MALTQEEMEQMPKPIEQAFSDLELKILEDIVARIKENNMITGTAEYDIFQLVKMGESEKMIKRYVEKTLKLTYSEIEDIFGDVFERGYNRDSNLYKAVGADFVAYKDNKQLQQFIGAIKDQTKGTYKNITNTMGFVRQREGVKTWVPLTKYYKETLSRAVFEITSGAFTYSQVVKRTINEMTNSGIRTIDYASGRTSRIEVAARRAIMTAVTQVTAKVTEQNMDKLHTDYVEVSWHETARPTHQVWQGRVFKWNRGNEVNAVSDKAQNEEQLLRNDPEYQDAIKQRREEWKKKHSGFDKATAKTEINNIKSQIEDMKKQINASLEKEKPLEKKVYIDGTGTDEDMRMLRQSANERKKLQEQVEDLNNNMLDKQEVYKNEAQNRILKARTVEVILSDANILDTIVYGIVNIVNVMPDSIKAVGMFLCQSLINCVIVSGTGQAAVTMPLMVPVSDLVGISRQTSVLAFQLGDGFSNSVLPMSSSLMGYLAVSKIPYSKWLKFMMPLFLIWTALGCLFMLGALMIGY